MNLKLILIPSLCAATFLPTNPPPQTQHTTVMWQYDEYRDRIEKYLAKQAYAIEFNRTNTNPMRVAVTESLMFQMNVTTNDIEMGYRSDGVVVWRKVPEAIRVGY